MPVILMTIIPESESGLLSVLALLTARPATEMYITPDY